MQTYNEQMLLERIDNLEKELEAFKESQKKAMMLLRSEDDHIKWSIQTLLNNGQIIRPYRGIGD